MSENTNNKYTNKSIPLDFNNYELRYECLELFEQIKDIVRDINPSLFNILTIEDLMEFIR
jgi:hypothetical protein